MLFSRRTPARRENPAIPCQESGSRFHVFPESVERTTVPCEPLAQNDRFFFSLRFGDHADSAQIRIHAAILHRPTTYCSEKAKQAERRNSHARKCSPHFSEHKK